MDARQAAKALQMIDQREVLDIDNPSLSTDSQFDQTEQTLQTNHNEILSSPSSPATTVMIDIEPFTDKYYEDAIELIRDYSIELGINLQFQGFEQELRLFPAEYSPSRRGGFFVAVQRTLITNNVDQNPMITSARKVQDSTDAQGKVKTTTIEEKVVGVIGLRAFKGFAGTNYVLEGCIPGEKEQETSITVTDMQGNIMDDPLSSLANKHLNDLSLPKIEPLIHGEIKRLYVTPEARGMRLGKKLGEAIIKEARTLGYQFLWLDTVPQLMEANYLYPKLGFKVVEGIIELERLGRSFYKLNL